MSTIKRYRVATFEDAVHCICGGEMLWTGLTGQNDAATNDTTKARC